MLWVSVVLMAVAVSFDAFAIGVTYGVNCIKIPGSARLVLSFVSGLAILGAMFLGSFFGSGLSRPAANLLGGLILVLLGFYSFWRSLQKTNTQRTLLNLRIPVLGLVIQVFQEPLAADYDQSQHISFKEALVLGGALAFDAIAAGFGAAVLKLPVFPTAASVVLASFLFISQGLKTGVKIASSAKKGSYLDWLPGTMLILIGLLKIFF